MYVDELFPIIICAMKPFDNMPFTLYNWCPYVSTTIFQKSNWPKCFCTNFINDPDCLLSKGLNEVPRGNRRVILQSTRIFDFKEQFCVGTSFSFWDQTGECKNKCHFKVTFVHDHFRICKIVTRKGNSPKTSSLGNFHKHKMTIPVFHMMFFKAARGRRNRVQS